MSPLERAIVRELHEHPRTAHELAERLARHRAEIRQALVPLYFGLSGDGEPTGSAPLLACDPFGRFGLRASLHLFPGFWCATNGAERGGRGLEVVLARTFGAGASDPPPARAQGVLAASATTTGEPQ